MTMQRRGFLGLLGATTAALPFMGQAVSLRSDPKTGALSIDSPEPIIPVAVEGDFLVIPLNRIRGTSVDFVRNPVRITSFDSSYEQFMPSDLIDLKLNISCDRAFASYAYEKISAHWGRS